MKFRLLIFFALSIILTQNFQIHAKGFNDIGARNGSVVWAVGDSGNVIRSIDGGVNFIRYNLGVVSYNAVSVRAQNVWIGGENGILKISTNNGTLFNEYSIGSNSNIRSINFTDLTTGWIAGDNGMILKTTNSGFNWTSQTSNTSSNLNSIKFHNSNIGVACGNNGFVCVTNNGGNNWTAVNTNVSSDLLSAGIYGSTIICSGKNATVIKSTDGGIGWNTIDYKLEAMSDVNSVSVFNESIFYSVGGGGFIWKSTNAGVSFDYQKNPLFADLHKSLFIDLNTGWCLSKNAEVILRTVNGGFNWLLPTGFSQTFTWDLKISLNFYTSSGNVFATNPKNKNAIYVTKSNSIYRSLDKGNTWSLISTIPGFPVNSPSNAFLISPKDTNIFLVAMDSSFEFFGKVFRSTDYGQTWSFTFSGPRNSDGCPLEMDPNHPDTVYYAPSDSFLYRSTNFGLTWNQVGTKRFRDICIVEVMQDSSNILLVGDAFYTGTLYRSSDWGLSWENVNDTNAFEIPDIATIKMEPSNVYSTFFEGKGGLKRSTNRGLNWININIDYRAWAVDIAKDDPNVYAYGTWSNNPIYITTNRGVTFFQTSTIQGGCFALFYYDRSTLFAQMTEGFYKLKITYSNPIGINQINSELPSEYRLSQNYPNPFNPVTKIKFDIPSNVKGQTSDVRIIVFDVLGKEVMSLVNEKLSPGSYETQFDGKTLPSGIYFYKLESGSFVDTKRMMLIK